MRKLLAVILGVVLGVSFSYGVAAIYKSTSAPAPIRTYSLLFLDGSTTQIGAERYALIPPCVVFYREGKTLAFCNMGVAIQSDAAETATPQPKPTSQGGSPSGPSRLDPNGRLQAESEDAAAAGIN